MKVIDISDWQEGINLTILSMLASKASSLKR